MAVLVGVALISAAVWGWYAIFVVGERQLQEWVDKRYSGDTPEERRKKFYADYKSGKTDGP